MVNIQFEKSIACGFQKKKRKCKQNFVAQLCVVDLGCFQVIVDRYIAIVLWPNIETLLYPDLLS